MNKYFLSFGCILLFFLMLLQPELTLQGTQNGLLLWSKVLLPTLFPFMIMTNLLIQTNSFSYITQFTAPLLTRLFSVTEKGSFAIITGFLCGYPMGAKVIGDLCKNQEISTNEAQYLLSFCNNASPAFVLNYICFSTLKQNELKLPSLIILLGTPVFCSFFFRRLYKINTSEPITYKAASINNSAKKHNILKVIDQSILYSFESLIKICGYVILFSILVLFFLRRNIFHSLLGKCCLASLEITNGISILSSLSNPLQYTAIIGMTAFGGFCSIFQTASVIADTDIKISNYIIEKLVTTMATSLIAYLYMILYH